MEGKIVIQGITLDLTLGVLEEERKRKQRVLLDLELFFEFPEEDELERTVDYSQAAELVQKLSREKFVLIEALAGKAARLVLDSFPSLRAVKVRAHKPRAPLPLKFQDLYAECYLER